jgi:cobaltochelatase CobS
MDLIGRDTLTEKDGVTISTFVEGVLPRALSGPNILLCDEVDFIRPEVAYVMQRVLEDEGVLLTEDGGRFVAPHEMFRIVATANTTGQGDEFAQYQGARNQSMAFLDRFTVWIDMPYLNQNEEKALLKSRVSDLSEEQIDTVIKYVQEHRNAFTKGTIVQPLSPRGVTALGKSIVAFGNSYKTQEEGIRTAIEITMLNRSNPQDRAILAGVVDRVFNIKE